MKFGENLKIVRKQRKISQEDLADKLGVSRQSVSKWETGENYPSMTNIMCLCTIFKCNINELVHEDMDDINSLGEEVKMSVVKFKEEKQKKVKVISKIINVMAKIGWICSIVGIVCVVIATIAVPAAVGPLDIQDNKISYANKEVVTFEETDTKLIYKTVDGETGEVTKDKEIKKTKEFIQMFRDNKTLLIVYIESAFISLIVCLSLTVTMLKHLDKLFDNIYNGDTPFTLENVDHIKKMAYYMIALIIAPVIASAFFNLAFRNAIDFDFQAFDIIQILFLFAISYIFEYGYYIQADSKGKMYGNAEE